jgi:hypothetical protein
MDAFVVRVMIDDLTCKCCLVPVSSGGYLLLGNPACDHSDRKSSSECYFYPS